MPAWVVRREELGSKRLDVHVMRLLWDSQRDCHLEPSPRNIVHLMLLFGPVVWPGILNREDRRTDIHAYWCMCIKIFSELFTLEKGIWYLKHISHEQIVKRFIFFLFWLLILNILCTGPLFDFTLYIHIINVALILWKIRYVVMVKILMKIHKRKYSETYRSTSLLNVRIWKSNCLSFIA